MQGFDPTVPQVGDVMDPDPIRLNFCAAFSHESGPTPPVTWSQMVGCCWFDTGANRMWIFSGTDWKPITWNTPHSTLTDLDKDDHPLYFTLDGTKTVQQMIVAPGGKVDTLDISTWQRFSVPFTSTDAELPCTVSLIVVSSLGGAGFDEVALHEGGVSPAYQHNIVLDRELRGSVWYAEDVKKQFPGFRVEAGRKELSFWDESEKTTYLPFENAKENGLVLCQVRTATEYWFVWKIHSVLTTMAIVKVKCLDGVVKAGLTLDYLGVFYD